MGEVLTDLAENAILPVMTQAAPTHLDFGTCSWNYDSWSRMIYSPKASHSAAYLREYPEKNAPVKVDSWFYNLPLLDDAKEYRSLTPEKYTLSCKLTESLSLIPERSKETFIGVAAFMNALSGDMSDSTTMKDLALLTKGSV